MNFDLIVIGSGPGGYKTAITAAHLGAKVALVEKSLPGGTCLNQGCIPKKTLLHLATLIEDFKDLQGRGLTGDIRGDFVTAIAHKDTVVAGIRDNFPVWLKRLGIQVFVGEAHIEPSDAPPYRVQVRNDDGVVASLEAARIVIATGATPRAHSACPTDGKQIIDSRQFMFDLKHRPESMLFVGGGAVGVELAFLMHQFGARVSLIDSAPRLLDKPYLSERVSQTLERKFERLGISVRKNISVAHSRCTPTHVEIEFTDGSREQFAAVLVAIGRQPASAGLGLEALGIVCDADGFIETDAYLETNREGIYAIGDVKHGPMTANAALHDAKIAAVNAIKGNQAQCNYNQVPIVIDSAFEIAAVGLTEERAEAAGFEAEVARSNFFSSAKSRARHDHEGFIEVVHDGTTGQLLGGCIVGPESGEQIHMLAAACQSDRGLWFFTDMNYSHPSWTEELENAIDPHTFAFTRAGTEIFYPGIYSRHNRS